MRSGPAASAASSPAWPWILMALGWFAYWRALGTYFAQDDFDWMVRALSGPAIPFGAPRFLSSGLYFGLLYPAYGFHPAAFHATNLGLHLASGLILYRVLAGRVRPVVAAAAAGIFLSSPASFDALHWVSAVTDLMCGLFLGLTTLALLGKRPRDAGDPSAWAPWVAPGAYALALGSKEIAAGAAPLFAWLAWRRPGRLRALHAGLYLALALAAAIPLAGALRGPTDPYSAHPQAALSNLPAYLSAAILGGLGAHVTSDVTWVGIPWVRIAGALVLTLWIAALWRRRSAGAWFGALWFLALLSPVLFLDRFYFYYLYCALPGLLASWALLADRGPERRGGRLLPVVGLVIILIQAAAVELRWRAVLPHAPLPRDFVLRRSVIARRALADLVAQRERLGPRVAMLSEQPIQSSSGGAVTTGRTDYEQGHFWDDNVRAAIAGGRAFRLVAPEVDSVVFLRWVAPADSDFTIVSYGIDGHLRVMDYRSYSDVGIGPGDDALRAHLERAGVLIQRRLFPAAARVLESAHRIAPDHPDVLINLGSTYAQLGDTAAAIRVLARLVERFPGDVDALYNLGALHWRTGRAAKARELWARLDSLAPGSDLARSARAALKGR